MSTRSVQVPTPDGTADAVVASPDDGERHPGVLLYPDIIGPRPVIHEMAERLASHGYHVLVPNLFYRHGPAPVVEVPDLTVPENREAFFREALPLLHEHTVERALADAGGYLDFLAARPEVRPGPVGTVGYCFGAVLAVRTAAARPDHVAAAAGFHPGSLVTDAPDSPHRLASDIAAELHFGFAEHDDGMKPEDIARWDEAMDGAGVTCTSEVYPGTVHGFTMADTSAFSPSGLDRHWKDLVPLLDRNLTTD